VFLGVTKVARCRHPKNPSVISLLFPASVPTPYERNEVVGGRPARGAEPPMSLFTGERRSPEGERATIERVCGSALRRGPRAQR
jgi:hypothetical protein